MKFQTKSHRQGDIILNDSRFALLYKEIVEVLAGISDQDIRSKHESKYSNKMSLSYAINDLINERFVAKGWMEESPIFQQSGYTNESKWRLDFAKDKISIEVAFNHGEAIAWNLLKPVLASEENNVKKAIKTEVGVVICATKALKVAGAFDSAVGEFEKILRYLTPLSTILSVPMLVIGLEAPETFKLEKEKINGRNVGRVVEI